jgi:hypothetical protein
MPPQAPSRRGRSAQAHRPVIAERRRRCQAFFLSTLAATGSSEEAFAALDALRTGDRSKILRLTCGRDLSSNTLREYCRTVPAELLRWAHAAYRARETGAQSPPLPRPAPHPSATGGGRARAAAGS